VHCEIVGRERLIRRCEEREGETMKVMEEVRGRDAAERGVIIAAQFVGRDGR